MDAIVPYCLSHFLPFYPRQFHRKNFSECDPDDSRFLKYFSDSVRPCFQKIKPIFPFFLFCEQSENFFSPSKSLKIIYDDTMQKQILRVEDADDGIKLKKWIRKQFHSFPFRHFIVTCERKM